MKLKIFAWAFFIWVFSTSTVLASVRINEIAWMGTDDSPTNEWIELYNDSTAVVQISGWSITAKDGSPTISLSGQISGMGYFLIERTDDNSVLGITADIAASFGAGLSNSGETLELRDASGAFVDVVVGGTNWTSIGGDNATKRTAQRVSGTKDDWTTGTPTPRATNVRPNPTPNTSSHTVGANEKATTVSVPLSSETIDQGDGAETVLWESAPNDMHEGIALSQHVRWFFVLVGIALILLAGMIIVRSGKQEESPSADDYTVIEDIIEGADD